MILNRKNPPPYKSIEKINIIKAGQRKLTNNIIVYTINAGTQDVVKIDFIFPAGKWFQEKELIATTTNSLLNEGTEKFSSKEVSKTLEYYGAILHFEADADQGTASLLTLNKHLEKVLPVVEEVLKNPVFPDDEIKKNLRKRKQEFIIESNKTSSLAKKAFSIALFGKMHPYGESAEITDFEKVNRSDLVSFFKKNYTADHCNIIVSGKIREKTYALLEKHFGSADWKKDHMQEFPQFSITQEKEKTVFVEKPGSVQSAIRIGKIMFTKKHRDFQGMKILNTVLGGYFGSRLMKNIREEKGYTYGIGSVLYSMQHQGYFSIVSEVGKNYTQKAIDEIYKEIRKLREEPVPDNELAKVKSYLLGAILMEFDGPFAQSEKIKELIKYDLDYEYYEQYIQTIHKMHPQKLQELANQYLVQKDLYEITAGIR